MFQRVGSRNKERWLTLSLGISRVNFALPWVNGRQGGKEEGGKGREERVSLQWSPKLDHFSSFILVLWWPHSVPVCKRQKLWNHSWFCSFTVCIWSIWELFWLYLKSITIIRQLFTISLLTAWCQPLPLVAWVIVIASLPAATPVLLLLQPILHKSYKQPSTHHSPVAIHFPHPKTPNSSSGLQKNT